MKLFGMWKFRWTKVRKVQVAEMQQKPQRFNHGDEVILLGSNPFKGSLKSKTIYTVLRAVRGYIQLEGINGTYGYFEDSAFVRADVVPVRNSDAADEYWDAMRGQEMLEGL